MNRKKYFNIYDGVLEEYTGRGGKVVIPEGVKVIGDEAFARCEKLKSVIIPEGVTTIGDRAFYKCNKLKNIVIPDSVIKIGSGAFSNTAWYSNQPEGLIYAGKTLYDYKGICPSEVKPKNGITSISDYAFSDCDELESIVIPEGVTTIGDEAFHFCSGLRRVTIPDTVKYIGEDVFLGCDKVTVITPHGSFAESYAEENEIEVVSNQSEIKEFVIKNGVLEKYNGDGGDVVIPVGVTSIGKEAFESFSKIVSVTIPDSVTTIGDFAFADCENLKEITIPYNVKSIGICAFCFCSGLTGITVDKRNPVYHSNGNCLIKTSTGELIQGCNTSVIPDDGSVKVIGESAFEYCTGLRDIIIPDSVTTICDKAFCRCVNLNSITVPNSVTYIDDDSFDNCDGLKKIRIHMGSYAHKYFQTFRNDDY